MALSFLLLIGTTLIADSCGAHIPKGYIYAAMGFSVFVEAPQHGAPPPRQAGASAAELLGYGAGSERQARPWRLRPSARTSSASAAVDRVGHLRRDDRWIAERLGRSGDAHPAGVAHPQPGDPCQAGDGGAERRLAIGGTRAGPLLGEVREVAFLGFHESIAHFAIEVSHLEDPTPIASLAEAATFADLRTVGPLLERNQGALLAYARGHDALAWAAPVLRCAGIRPRAWRPAMCGAARTATCGASHFPRTDPAVIMLVHDGERVVLGRQKIWPPGMAFGAGLASSSRARAWRTQSGAR